MEGSYKILVRNTVTVCTAAFMLAGCGGSQPIGAPLTVGITHVATHPAYGQSWMEPKARTEDLLYVADPGDNIIRVFSLARGKLVGQLSENYQPNGACVDRRNNVFFPEAHRGDVIEYAHGRKRPEQALKGTAVVAFSCSIDPTTGNLAVTNFLGSGDTQGSVMIYQGANGSPVTYRDPNVYEYFFCGYDNNGNLFVDGFAPGQGVHGSGGFAFAELPKGGSTFTDITLNQSINWPGQVQWDGKYVAVGDQTTTNIYQFAVSGSAGTLQATTTLSGASYVQDFWIRGSHVIVDNAFNISSQGYTEALFYNYPAGGAPIKNVGRHQLTMEGVTVSLAPH
jgi:hypothetical protein